MVQDSLIPLPTLQSTQLPLSDKLGVLDMDIICRELNIESITKATSQKHGALNRVGRFLAPEHLSLLY